MRNGKNGVRFICLAVLLAGWFPAGSNAQGTTTLTVDGETVTILRDGYGVPHVFASSLRGLFYGNGYAVAQDRLGQMELYRRSARGEMAELVGQNAVAADRETRLDGYTETEREEQFDRLSPELKTMFTAYADGVNAYVSAVKSSGKTLQVANFPVKFDPAALRPWKVTDSIAIGEMMARRFGGDEGGELRNMLLFGFLKNQYKNDAYRLFNDVAWRNDPAAPTTLPPAEDTRKWSGKTHWTDAQGRVIGSLGDWVIGSLGIPSPNHPTTQRPNNLTPSFDPSAARRAADILDQKARMRLAARYGLMTKWGSYCLVVSKAKSATGNALLAGGPQMGFRTPQIAHEIHLSGAGIDGIGMGFAGIPGVLIGHNPYLAWSTTTGVNDQTDIFVETLDPNDPTRYKFKGEWRQMEKRVETIHVAGGEPVTLEVYRTIHGPVVQVDKTRHLAYSRSATYWDKELGTFAAIAKFHTARTVREFGAACALITTSHNFFCATRDGDIGFWFCGRTPLRDPRVDPRFPTPGDGSREWRGIMPFAQQPQIINPKQGFLANWNTKPAVWWDCCDTPVWGEVWHSGRIAQLLARKPKISAEDLRNVLLDIGTNDYTAQVFLPLLNAALKKNAALLSPPARTAAGYLAAWDHHATEGSVARTIFDAWLQQTREDLFLKPFGFIRLAGPDLFNLAMQPSYILHVLKGKDSPVPVQYDYLGGKTPDRVMAEALNRAVEKLAKEKGPEMALWRYSRGQINFSPLPPIPSTDRGTYIQIVECAKPQIRGVSICPPGQSERTDSPHFSDQRELAGWFFFKPMLTTREEIEKSGQSVK
jgi:penicillin amidase